MNMILQRKKLGEIIKLEYGKPLPESERKLGGPYPVYGANGAISRSDLSYVNHRSIIVGRKGSAGELNLTEKDFWPLDVTYFVTYDEKKYDLGFLYRLLASINLPKLAKGVKPGLNRNDVYTISVKIPELIDDQKKIAQVIDAADILRHKRRKAINLLDDYLKSVFLEMFGDLVKNPKGWQVKKLADIADICSGVTKGRKIDRAKAIMVPYMRVANVQDEHIDLAEIKEIEALPTEVEKYRLIEGDVLLTEGGDPDKLGRGGIWRGQIANCIHQNHIFRVRLVNAFATPEYVSAQIGSAYGKRYFLKSAKQTTGIASINMTQLKRFPVLLPNLELQIKYAQISSNIRSLKQKMLAQSEELENQFQALMQKAFRGDL